MTRKLNARISNQQIWKIEWSMCFIKMIQYEQNCKMVSQQII